MRMLEESPLEVTPQMAVNFIAAAIESAVREANLTQTDKCSGLDKQHEINVAATQRSYQEIRRALKMGKDEGLINGAERVREERDEWERKAEYAGEQYRRRNREAQAMEATLKDIASPHAMRSWDAMQQEARAALRKLEESRTAATTEPKP